MIPMIEIDDVIYGLETDVRKTAEKLTGNLANQATGDAMRFLVAAKDDIERWTKMFATGDIDKDMLIFLINSERGLGAMKFQTYAGLARIKFDQFFNNIKMLVVNKLVNEVIKPA